jgi:hypothetical protein
VADDDRRRFPRWLFAVLAAGGLLAAGIYIGMMRVEGPTTGGAVLAALYGVFGVVMLWGAASGRS